MKKIGYYFNKKSIIGMLVAPIFLALGINIFIAPNSLAFGGVSGAAIVIGEVSGIPIYIISLIFNVVILIIGGIFKGKEFLIKTIIPSLLIPFYIYLTTPLQSLQPDLIISVFYGPLFMGLSIGLVLALGGSTGGPDTIGEILEKHLKIPAKWTRVVIDASVIISGMYIFGLEVGLYSLTVLFILQVTVEKTRTFLINKNIFQNEKANKKSVAADIS